jgi:predicted transcriptional regulator
MMIQQIVINERIRLVKELREHGFSNKLIAEIIGQSERNISNYVARAKQQEGRTDEH